MIKINILSVLIISLLAEVSLASNCIYGKLSQCPKGFYCINVDKDKVECREEFKKQLITVLLPFKKNVKVWCDQGTLPPPGNSHAWLNTAFALDLQSSRKNKAVEVVSSFSGTVITFDECKTQNDQCGLGFGNQVKVMTEDGYMQFFAHLEKVFVKTGQKVKVGDVLGLEGTTGWTGKDNRHLHLSLHYDWRPAGFDYWKQTGYLPEAIPYLLVYCEENCSADCKKNEIDIRDLN